MTFNVHFDVTESFRLIAILHGATPVTAMEGGRLRNEAMRIRNNHRNKQWRERRDEAIGSR